MPKTTLVKNEDCHLTYELIGNLPSMHLEVYNWSPKKYKEFLGIWIDVLKMFNKKGYPYVFVFIDAQDEKLVRFEELFGFEPLFHLTDEVLVMYRSTLSWD